jgi:hypothetical protein
MKNSANLAILLLVALISRNSLAAVSATMDVGFGENGLNSLRYGGSELLSDGIPGLRALVTMHGTALTQEPIDRPSVAFDAKFQRLDETFAWGRVSTVYTVDGNRLFIDLTVDNTSKQDIRQIDLALMRLKLPGKVDAEEWETRWPQPIRPCDDPQIVPLHFAGSLLLLCGEEVDRSIGLHVFRDSGSGEYSLVLRDEGMPMMDGAIGAGDRREFKLSVRLGRANAPLSDLAPDILSRFSARYPYELNWKDRRPIGSINLSSSAMGIEKNPRGWFMDRTSLDVTTEAGRQDFRQRLLKYADTCIEFTRQMNAQGVIVWDIEGQEMPHMISYIGDPRLTEQMAPEMADAADAFMQRFRDAGLRVGVTVRPSQLIRSAGGKNRYEQVQVPDPVEQISRKIEYACKRWGCTLFYVDSTTLWVNENDGKLSLKTMPADFFQILHERFPNVLLIPEQSTTRHWAYCACYHELQQGFPSTPAEVRAVYPQAFSVLRVVDAGMDLVAKRHDELVAGVRSGDILLYRTWFNDEYDAAVKQIYAEARAGR